MQLHKAAQLQIAKAQASGRDLTYYVSEDKTARYPWRLTLRYVAADPLIGHEYPAKIGLRWFRTRESAEAAREGLETQERARLGAAADRSPVS